MKCTEPDGQMRRTQYVDVVGGRIAYEVAGQGRLVVLSPGMGTPAVLTASSAG